MTAARRRIARVLAGYAALLVVALALTAAAAAPHSAGSGLAGAAPATRAGLEAALSLLAGCGLVLLAVLLAWQRRRRLDEQASLSWPEPPSRWARMLAMLVALLIVAGTVATAVVLLRTQHPRTPAPSAGPGSGRLSTSSPSLASFPAGGPGGAADLVAAAVVVGVLVLAVLGYAAWSRRHRGAASDAAASEPEPEPEPAPALAGALRDAADALRLADGTPRQVIIACYRAMTRRLGRAGAEPAAADAPEELLERAAGAGLVVPQPARQLAALFQEARFSTHPIGAVQQQQAVAALEALRASLAADTKAANTKAANTEAGRP